MRDRPLAGRRVAVTRPTRQADALCDAFECAGAAVVRLPAFRVALVDDCRLEDALGTAYDTVVFTSPNAVEFFFEVAARAGAVVLERAEVVVVGPSTAAALNGHGRVADIVADPHTAEGLVATLRSAHGTGALAGRRVLYPRARDARDVIERELTDSGARVDAVVMYGTVAETVDEPTRDALRAGPLDVITFASPSAARHLEETLDRRLIERLKSEAIAACIGPVTADAARRLGYRVAVVADTSTAAGLADAVSAYYQKES